MKRLLVVLLVGVGFFLFTFGVNRLLFTGGDNARKHYNRGNAYHRQGKYDLAIESYQKAIAINPDYAEAHNNLVTLNMT